MNLSEKAKLITVISNCLDNLNVSDATIDIPIVDGSELIVYITPPSGKQDDIDYVSIYDAIAADPTFDSLDIEIEVVDTDEKSDALEGAYGTSESEDDEEEEDELEADNLRLVEDGYDDRDQDYDEDEDEDEDFEDADEDDVGGIDEYQPSWRDLEEMMRESDEYQ